MGHRITYWWNLLRESFWFLPTILVAAAVGLSFAAVETDRIIESEGKTLYGWTYRGGADGARGVLSTVAASMMTVAGVVFSVTVVALSLASQQFGPRLIRNFTRDRGNQIVLGTFVATFVYCLLVLRTVNGTDDLEFVPQLGVTLAVLLALASIGVLIYFIHHVAMSIQASAVIERVAKELDATIEAVFPEDSTGLVDPPEETAVFTPAGSTAVRATHPGYILGIDSEGIRKLAGERNYRIAFPLLPGGFVSKGDTVAHILARGEEIPDADIDRVREAVMLASRRTLFQDVEFAFLQLTEIAVRALSPSINDPFTAQDCVERLGHGFCKLATRKFPPVTSRGTNGLGEVTVRRPTFPTLLDTAFDPVRHAGKHSPEVLRKMAATLVSIWNHVEHPADRTAVMSHIARVVRAGDQLAEPDDRETVRAIAGKMPVPQRETRSLSWNEHGG